MYLTSQRDDANTGVILFNTRTWMLDHTVFLSQQTKYSMCLIHCSAAAIYRYGDIYRDMKVYRDMI